MSCWVRADSLAARPATRQQRRGLSFP
eukprot:COSAG06_NODE_46501_length_346_cov_0.955466_1_plen_26_part_10